MASPWIDASDSSAALDGDTGVDVVVVGAGITGISTALRLSEAGYSVAVVEGRRIGEGNTGRSTGNLYATVSQGLVALRKKWNADQVRCAVAARTQAKDWIVATAAQLGIECGLVEVPLHQCVSGSASQSREDLRAEHEAAAEAGLPASWSEHINGWPLPVSAVHTLAGQAHFNPYRFVAGVAAHLRGQGVQLYENTRVLDINASAGAVVTNSGTVRADAIVLATHTPPGFNLLQAEMEVYREYGVAARLGGPVLPQASVWAKDASQSLRTWHRDEAHYLVVVGQKHKTGEAGQTDHLQRLRDYARQHFQVDTFTHAWSAQQYRSADGLPYIGPSAHGNVFLATGFGADGLTWGAVAAQIICELVQQRASEVGDLLAARRFTPIKSAAGFAKENRTTASHLVGDRLKARKTDEATTGLAANSGRIIYVDGEPCAEFRDAAGQLTTMSAVCPHLKCLVQWNGSERTWDCPCHGSRFDTRGCVIEGPALTGLEPKPAAG